MIVYRCQVDGGSHYYCSPDHLRCCNNIIIIIIIITAVCRTSATCWKRRRLHYNITLNGNDILLYFCYTHRPLPPPLWPGPSAEDENSPQSGDELFLQQCFRKTIGSSSPAEKQKLSVKYETESNASHTKMISPAVSVFRAGLKDGQAGRTARGAYRIQSQKCFYLFE